MTHPAEAADFDTIEAQIKAGEEKGSGALTTKLDGDAIPEELRGKTVADLIEMQKGLKAAVLTSESARAQTNERLAQIEGRLAAPAVAPVAAPVAAPEYTDEQFQEEYEKSPATAMLKLQKRSETILERNISSRVAPILDGTSQTVEAGARAKFTEEFELFGTQIDDFVKTQMGGKKPATPQAWEHLVSFVRGQPANVEKLFERRTNKTAEAARVAAQAAAEAATGFSGTAGAVRAPAGSGKPGELDATEKEVVAQLVASGVVKNEAEYIKWKGVR